MVAIAALAIQCGVPLSATVLAAIVEVESGGSPNALAVNGGVELVRQPRDKHEAALMALWLERHGYNFDAGLAQVNSANFARLGLTVANVFDPCTNLRAAARVFEECQERARARWGEGGRSLSAGLSCYNTGDLTRGESNGYVDRVRARIGPWKIASRKSPSRANSSAAGTVSGLSRRNIARAGTIALENDDVFGQQLADAFGSNPGRAGQ